jgi:hypothetical protein
MRRGSRVNSGRVPSAFDLVVFVVVMILGVAWATALNPESIPLMLILAGLVGLMLGMLAIIVTRLVSISDWLSPHFDRIVHFIVRNRKQFMLPKWSADDVKGIKAVFHYLVSTLFFFLVFMGYFAIMVVFFYGLGGPPLSDPYRLASAAFLGTLAVHFSGHIKMGDVPRAVFAFLVPFGMIVGALDLEAFGSLTWLWAEWLRFGPAVVLFFAVYYGLDFIAERYAIQAASRNNRSAS